MASPCGVVCQLRNALRKFVDQSDCYLSVEDSIGLAGNGVMTYLLIFRAIADEVVEQLARLALPRLPDGRQE